MITYVIIIFIFSKHTHLKGKGHQTGNVRAEILHKYKKEIKLTPEAYMK